MTVTIVGYLLIGIIAAGIVEWLEPLPPKKAWDEVDPNATRVAFVLFWAIFLPIWAPQGIARALSWLEKKGEKKK